MKFINALALNLGVIGGILAYLCLGPASGWSFIWAIFIATATGIATGGTGESFKNLVVCGAFGVVMAWIASLIVLNVPLAATLTLPVWAAIVVGITTAMLALAAHLPILPAIPVTVVGYAMTFAYLLQTPARLSNAVLLSLTPANPLFVMIASIVVGAGFGIVALKSSGRLSSKVAG